MLRDLEIYNIDYSAANTEYRREESHNVSDLNGRVLIPYEGPMYARNLVVRGDGKPLSVGTDYELEDDFVELENITGKKVIGSIRVSRQILSNYKVIKISYQQVCDIKVSRKYLLDSMDKIINSDTTIDWTTQVFNKPDTFPVAAHTHDARESDEMVGFHDLVLLFKQAGGQTQQHGKEVWDALKVIEDNAFATLDSYYKTLWNNIFTHIMDVNKPHPMTKADIGLGNHPNYGTATLEEDQAAAFYSYDDMENGSPVLRDDVISTPHGVASAIDNYDVDTDGFVRQGTLPFSYYGSGFYIPPSIYGSFEGLGTDTGGSALCRESNGYTTLLTRGFDSKVRNLYYYYNKDIYNSKEDFVFSAYAYYSKTMEDNGDTPNHIVSGSSGRILVIGDRETNQYYVCLGNGTLDFNSHNLKKINMNSFYSQTLGKNLWNRDTAYVMLIGDYIYIIVNVNGWAPEIPESERFGGYSYRTTSFYRVNISALTDTSISEVTFTRQLMNYQNTEGDQKYNQKYVNICKNVVEVDSDGNKVLKKCVFNFSKPPTNNDIGGGWKAQWFNMENPENKNEAAIHLFHMVRTSYGGTANDYPFCIPMFLDTSTNTLRLDNRFFQITIDPETSDVTVPEGFNRDSWYHPSITRFTCNYIEQAAAWIPKLGYASCGTNISLLPYKNFISFMGYNPNSDDHLTTLTDWEMFNQDLTLLTRNGSIYKNIPLDSPFGFTSTPMFQNDLWVLDNIQRTLPIEVFHANDKNGYRAVWYRMTNESYDYAERSVYDFKYIDKNIIGRVPSTQYGKVYYGQLPRNYGKMIAVVNTSRKDKYGVQYGMMNICSGNYNSEKGSHTVYAGLYYSNDPSKLIYNSINILNNAENDLYISLLGNEVLNAATNEITISPVPSQSVVIPKAQWLNLVKTLLGNEFSTVSTSEGGDGTDGEWILSFYVSAQEGSGNDVIPSIAYIYWHNFSDPTNTYGRWCTFNWKTTSTKSTGEKVIELTNIAFPDNQYSPNAKTVVASNFNYNSNGKWESVDISYTYEAATPEIQIDFTDSNNYQFWMCNGINIIIPHNGSSICTEAKVENGALVSSKMDNTSIYVAGLYVRHKLYVTDLGITTPLSFSQSGGAALYVYGGKIPDNKYAILQAVFVEGNWTVFVSSDLTAIFNGTYKTIRKTNYDLSTLGIDQRNKTFYLYAVSGKVEGYYDLSLSERTASPYHLLVATIYTNDVGITEIVVEQKFAISGFGITTSNKGGSVPATIGAYPETGTFDAIVREDLFDSSSY